MRIPHLKIKILPESNPPKSRISVRRLEALGGARGGARASGGLRTCVYTYVCIYIYIYMYICVYISLSVSLSRSLSLSIYLSIYLYIYIYIEWPYRRQTTGRAAPAHTITVCLITYYNILSQLPITITYCNYLLRNYDIFVTCRQLLIFRGLQLVRPVHLSRVSLLRVLESIFPGDPLSNSTDMRIPTPEN